jgi:D-alanine--poly(phosphoribitol) ligase subunit 1
MARKLWAIGVRRGDIVCISGKKDIYAYLGILACLRIGAGYAMLDDSSPLERLRRIVGICNPSVLFVDPEFHAKMLSDEKLSRYVQIVWGEDLDADLDMRDDSPLEQTLHVTGEDIAYLMFTSGSTGFPKGVIISHSSVLNFVQWSAGCFDIAPDDILTGVNPLYFDNSVFDIYSSMMTGAALLSLDRHEVRNPAETARLVDAVGATIWFSVPSMLIFMSVMRVLGPAAFRTVTRIVFGGEGYPKPKLKQIYEWFGSRARIVNVYGPTECTCICSAYDVAANDFADMDALSPIGKVAPNFDFLILDGDRPVAKGEIGELCLLGPNVGKGYFSDLARTAESFVHNPLNSLFRQIMYRTGDLVRLGPAGELIHFVGRADNQVKHMGYRIELQEVENAINRIPYVDEAAVVQGYVNELSNLVAMVSVRGEHVETEVIDDLRKLIPDYMIPQRITITAALPKNQNGKIDRKEIKNRLFG